MRDMQRDQLVNQHGAYSQVVKDYDAAKRAEAQRDQEEFTDPLGKATTWQIGGGSSWGGTGGGGGLAILAILLIVGFGAILLREPAETDGIRPEGVSQEAFERNPTAGKVSIEKCGSIYRYRYRNRRYGYTLSRTPPQAEVDTIDEGGTWGVGGRQLSRGRRIRREKAMPVSGIGNYILIGGEKIFCSDFYYTPPSTASAAEQRLAR
jgi:hypothetical protein